MGYILALIICVIVLLFVWIMIMEVFFEKRKTAGVFLYVNDTYTA